MVSANSDSLPAPLLRNTESLQVWAWSGALVTLALRFIGPGHLAVPGVSLLWSPFAVCLAIVSSLAVLSNPKLHLWLARPLCTLTGACFTMFSLILVRWAGSL